MSTLEIIDLHVKIDEKEILITFSTSAPSDQAINVIEKYQEIVVDGFKIPNEKVKAKYTWLNNYLDRVLLHKEFQKNIINNWKKYMIN